MWHLGTWFSRGSGFGVMVGLDKGGDQVIRVVKLHKGGDQGGEALAQAAQRSCGFPLPGRVQGQVGWSAEHPGLVGDVPAHGRGVEPDDL